MRYWFHLQSNILRRPLWPPLGCSRQHWTRADSEKAPRNLSGFYEWSNDHWSHKRSPLPWQRYRSHWRDKRENITMLFTWPVKRTAGGRGALRCSTCVGGHVWWFSNEPGRDRPPWTWTALLGLCVEDGWRQTGKRYHLTCNKWGRFKQINCVQNHTLLPT